jgi:hypothetical protein
MNSSNRSRNGIRDLRHLLNYGINRRCFRHATTMLGGARRPRQPDTLAQLCSILTRYLRVANRMARRDPHLFGPHARQYYLDTLELVRFEQETQVALDIVYGPPAPGKPRHVSTIWTDRYASADKNRRMFLNWFKEQYPDP